MVTLFPDGARHVAEMLSRRNPMPRRAILLVTAIPAVLVLVGCESRTDRQMMMTEPAPPKDHATARPDSESEASDREAEAPKRESESATREQTAVVPEPPRQTTAGEASEPGRPTSAAVKPDEPGDREEPLPRYLEVLERYDDSARAVVRARLERPAKLEIQTDNVKRLRITRARLPLTSTRSTVLRIDDQVFEWLQRSDEVVLERSRNGIWSPIKQGTSGP